jgi:hypothetical protein
VVLLSSHLCVAMDGWMMRSRGKMRSHTILHKLRVTVWGSQGPAEASTQSRPGDRPPSEGGKLRLAQAGEGEEEEKTVQSQIFFACRLCLLLPPASSTFGTAKLYRPMRLPPVQSSELPLAFLRVPFPSLPRVPTHPA